MAQRSPATRRVVAYYDAAARQYADQYAERSPAGVALRIRQVGVLALFDQPGGLVLDVGCGPAAVVPELRARGCRVWGVDISRGMIAEAHRRHGRALGVAFARARAEQLPYRDGAFDAVLSLGALEYTEDDRQSLAELVRVLRPGGTLIVTLGHRWSLYSFWMRSVYNPLVELVRPWYCRLRGQPTPIVVHRVQRVYAERWVRRHLPGGVHVEQVVYSNFKLLPAPLDSLLPWLDVTLLQRLQGLGRGPLRWLGTALLVKARKL